MTFLVTPGSDYIIQMVEFSSFRGTQLTFIFLFYFILISLFAISFVLVNRLTKKIKYDKIFYGFFLAVILCTLLYISNVFFSIYLILTIISFFIVYSSILISKFIWGQTTHYGPKDVIYESNYFNTKELAELEMKNKRNEINKLCSNELDSSNMLDGTILESENQYYFVIFSQNNLVIDDFKKEQILDDKITT